MRLGCHLCCIDFVEFLDNINYSICHCFNGQCLMTSAIIPERGKEKCKGRRKD
jgi:hypothetical protein